jgi:hypothetical protein
MNEMLLSVLGILSVALIAGLKMFSKSFRKKGKVDASVLADALDAAIAEAEKKK